jgi:hypothetical protein
MKGLRMVCALSGCVMVYYTETNKVVLEIGCSKKCMREAAREYQDVQLLRQR